jgi:hypothetical protein
MERSTAESSGTDKTEILIDAIIKTFLCDRASQMQIGEDLTWSGEQCWNLWRGVDIAVRRGMSVRVVVTS